MGTIEIGHVEDADAAVVSAFEQGLKVLLAHPSVVGGPSPALHAGPHTDAAEFQIAFAEWHRLVGIELDAFGFDASHHAASHEHPGDTQGGPLKELATLDSHSDMGFC